MREHSLIGNINSSDLCSGCGLCEAVAGKDMLSVEISGKGLFRPVQKFPLTHKHEATIKACCPGIHLKNDLDGANYELTWGPVKALQRAYATDTEVRFEASSGGALSALLIYLLESKNVDFVLHTGVSQNDVVVNATAISRCRADVIRNAGSRYSPSAPLKEIGRHLDNGSKFAVVGKPCDIAALRSYAQFEHRINRQIPYMLSFFCGGIPSVEGTENVFRHFSVSKQDVNELRYRGRGWPGKLKVSMKNGTQHEMTYDDSWGKILNRSLQLRCKICTDSIGEFADVVLGDAWILDEQGNPKFDESNGLSVAISRTEKGVEMVSQCTSSGHLFSEPLTVETLNKMQPYQSKRKKLALSRLLAMKCWFLPTPGFEKKHLLRAAFTLGIIHHLKSFAGMFIRAGRQRIQDRS